MTAAQHVWSGLEAMGGGSGLWADWQWALGDQLHALAPFLEPTHEEALTVPCREHPPCGCRHRVCVEEPAAVEALREGGLEPLLSAVCDCDSGDCPTFQITRTDRVIYRLDLARLGACIRTVLGLDAPRASGVALEEWREIGTWPPFATPVYLSLVRAGRWRTGLEAHREGGEGPCVLLTGTTTGADPLLAAALRREGGLLQALDTMLEPGPEGQWRFVESAADWSRVWHQRLAHPPVNGESLRQIQRHLSAIRRQVETAPATRPGPGAAPSPEPVSEDAARQVFALIRQLETNNQWRKAPMLQVFRLYCLEGLTAKQVAHRCGCAKSLIIERLKHLRQITGRQPTELRQFSAHFEQIDNSLRDPRARRIYRPALADEVEED